MDKYHEAIFEFATKEENFEFTFEIGNNFELFRRELINNFWDKVIYSLTEKETELNGWIPWREAEVIKGSDTIAGIYSNDYFSEKYDASVYISFFNWGDGRMLYGIRFNWDIPEINYSKVVNSARKNLGEDWQFAPKTWAWPVYKYTDENFKNYSSLKKILPKQSELLVEEYVTKLIAAQKELLFLVQEFGVKF